MEYVAEEYALADLVGVGHVVDIVEGGMDWITVVVVSLAKTEHYASW